MSKYLIPANHAHSMIFRTSRSVGFPVLFVSGLGGFASFWQDQVAAFAKRFEVVTFDHRGFGESDPSRIGYTVERMAADVVVNNLAEAASWILSRTR